MTWSGLILWLLKYCNIKPNDVRVTCMTTNGVQLTSLNIIIFILWVSHMSITEDETTSDIDFQTLLAFCSLILTSCQC